MTESQFPADEVGLELTDTSMALAESPAHRFEIDGRVTWLLARHDDIRRLLTDPRFSRAVLAKPGNHEVGETRAATDLRRPARRSPPA